MPTPRRQVNENWLTRYRGWVYGISFGAQLGVGFTTYVTSAAFYAAACAAVASGSLAAGALIMGTFGDFRGASVFSTAKVKTSPAVYRFARRLLVLDRPTARLTTALEVSLGLALATYGALQFG